MRNVHFRSPSVAQKRCMLSIITEKTTKLTFHELNESNFQRNIVDGSVRRLVSIFSLTEEVTAGNSRDHGDNFKVVRLK